MGDALKLVEEYNLEKEINADALNLELNEETEELNEDIELNEGPMSRWIRAKTAHWTDRIKNFFTLGLRAYFNAGRNDTIIALKKNIADFKSDQYKWLGVMKKDTEEQMKKEIKHWGKKGKVVPPFVKAKIKETLSEYENEVQERIDIFQQAVDEQIKNIRLKWDKNYVSYTPKDKEIDEWAEEEKKEDEAA